MLRPFHPKQHPLRPSTCVSSKPRTLMDALLDLATPLVHLSGCAMRSYKSGRCCKPCPIFILISGSAAGSSTYLLECFYPMTTVRVIARELGHHEHDGATCRNDNHAMAILPSVLNPVFEIVTGEAPASFSLSPKPDETRTC